MALTPVGAHKMAADAQPDMPPWVRGEAPLRVRDFVFAAAIVAGASCLGFFWVMHLWPSKIAMLFLAAVLLTGYRFGMWPAISAAFLAFLS
ncbi:MAG TPA: DUF4118 domain-containing protein, partial [Rudaea sp.]|nr:DUF4118 domain-containing protein [Rudaea sp.]